MKLAIWNADDFGYSRGINRGVIEAHTRGVLTSATLMVNAPATEEAVTLAREHPQLSVGLHVNFTNEADRLIEFDDPATCRRGVREHFDRFLALMGRLPSHLDSHQHIHRRPACRPAFEELADEIDRPLRDRPPVVFKGGFYAQWEYGVTDLSKVSLEALERIVRGELVDGGVYEFCCHPGYHDPALQALYHVEREHELRTLCDPRLRQILAEEAIRPISFADWLELRETHGRS